MIYKNEQHEVRYRKAVLRKGKTHSRRFLAAVYLLTSQKELWDRARYAVSNEKIEFNEISRSNIRLPALLILLAARDLYEGRKHIHLTDIGDQYLITDWEFMLIIEAAMISREGYGWIRKTDERTR